MLIKTINNELLTSYLAEDARFRAYSDGSETIMLACVMGIPMSTRMFAALVSQRLTGMVNLQDDQRETESLWRMGVEIPQDAIKRFLHDEDEENDPFAPQACKSADDGGVMDACQNAVAALMDKLSEDDSGYIGLKRAIRDIEDAQDVAVIDVTPEELSLFPANMSRIFS
jgi:hypothetical protein